MGSAEQADPILKYVVPLGLHAARAGRRLWPGWPLVREVMDDAAREPLVNNVIGHLFDAGLASTVRLDVTLMRW